MTDRLRRNTSALIALAAFVGCGKPASQDDPATAGPPPESEAPVALNADSPIGYPPALYDQRIEGDVVLRLFIDSTGHMVPESTRVAESSGFPALDSAALAGSPQLHFAPAKRRGIPIATAFLQPIEFRRPESGAAAPNFTPGPPAGTVAKPAPVAQPPRPRPSPDSTVRRDSTARRDTTPRDTTPRDTTRKADTTRADTNEVAH